MIDGEVFCGDAGALHPQSSQRVADGHVDGGTCGRGQVQGADFAIHRGIENHITAPSQLGVDPANQRDADGAAEAEVGKDRQQLVSFTAVGEHQGDVVGVDDPQVAVEGVHRVEEYGCQSDGGRGGGNLSGHDAAFTDACDHQLGAIGTALNKQRQGRFHLVGIEAGGRCCNRRSLILQATSESRHRD